MTTKATRNFEKVFSYLVKVGLLLVTGPEIPSVSQLITNRSVKGSWWADPAAHEIFAINEQLADHPDVTVTKLVSGKVTFVHRTLWANVYAIGYAREYWQTATLTSHAKMLLEEIDGTEWVLTNNMPASLKSAGRKIVQELELRLLVHAEQFHTEKGSHTKRLETWPSWAKRVNFKPGSITPARARDLLERRLRTINEQHSGRGRLPWQII